MHTTTVRCRNESVKPSQSMAAKMSYMQPHRPALLQWSFKVMGFGRGSELGKGEPGLDERHPPGHRASCAPSRALFREPATIMAHPGHPVDTCDFPALGEERRRATSAAAPSRPAPCTSPACPKPPKAEETRPSQNWWAGHKAS